MAHEPSFIARWLHRVLTSAPAMRFKRHLRDLAWSLRSSGVRNPPWPRDVRSLLFVCYGNICRSPFAARLAARRLEQAGLRDVRCASAGFRTTQHAMSPPDAVTVAGGYQVTLGDHRPLLITDELVRAHDVIFVMEPGQLQQLRRRWPGEHARFFLLSLFEAPEDGTRGARGAYERLHIVDPYGRGEAAFHEAYGRIAVAVDRIVALCAASRK